MSKIGQIIEFNREEFFDGAVQSDWFYDVTKREKVAESYIFHGPKYFGVGENDIANTKHKLIDSISFVNSISEKISYDTDSSRFVLTIAGYGAGKSHLSVAMGAIFSGDDLQLQSKILKKIEVAEPSLAKNIKSSLIKPNLVIVLNGMNDFNLNYEVLRCTREALKLHNINDDFLKDITKAHSIAVTFVENTFTSFKENFIKYANKYQKYKNLSVEILKEKLITNMESDINAFEIVNETYNEINGNYIRWDNGLTAGDILKTVNKVLCEERGIFNKIIILFDEFGRYIEYTSSHPQQAGESALQQIFEAIQNANKKILFVGFIQSDLSAYLSRVQNTNIKRYVSRYEGSDKYYLSSNLETILANLLTKKKPEQYDIMIDNIINGEKYSYNESLFNNIHRWIKDANKKGVWKDRQLYNNVILKGSYPIHPLTTWIMSTLSTWMQQRSTLTFVEDIFEDIKDEELSREEVLYVYPISIVKSKLFNELLNAEEKGLQQSQNCILYNAIMTKYGEKLSDNDIKVLQAILISNIGRFTPYNKEDMIDLIKYSSGLEENIIVKSVKELESNFGVIRFDDSIKRFEMLADANGRNEFNRKLINYKIRVSTINPLEFIDETISTDMGLTRFEETTFALDNHISSTEWKFSKRIINSKFINEDYIKKNISMIKPVEGTDISTRGIINFVYVDKDSYDEVGRINKLLYDMNNSNYASIYILVYDSENKIKDALIEYQALKQFSKDEMNDFSKFIANSKKICIQNIVRTFILLTAKKQILIDNKIIESTMRMPQYCNEILKKQFTKVVSFSFDGFEKKILANTRRYFVAIARGLITNTITNNKGIKSLDSDVLNRLKSVLCIDNNNSWKIMSSTGLLLQPQTGILKEMYEDVYNKLELNKPISIRLLFAKYLDKPYTMNQYSLSLFIAYFIGFNSNELNIYNSTEKLKKVDFANKVFADNKIDFTYLLRCTIEKVEMNKKDDIKRSIDSITNTLYVDKCGEGLIKLRELEKEEDIDEYLPTIELLKQKMTRGIEKYKDLKSELNVYNEFFEKYFEKSFVIKAIGTSTIKRLFDTKYEEKISGTEFNYSQEYINKINDLKKNILKSIDSNLEECINKGFKFKYEDYKQEESYIRNIGVFLRNNGRDDLANLVEQSFKRRKQLLIEEQKFERVFHEFDNFIKRNRNLDNRNYSELEGLKEDLKTWNDTIGELNISKERKRTLLNSIVNLTEIINLRRRAMDSIRDEIYIECKKVTSKTQIRDIEVKINRYLSLLPEQEDEIQLKRILDMAQSLNQEFKQLELCRNDRKQVKELTIRLAEEFKESFLSELVNNQIIEINNNLDRLDFKWKQEQIINKKAMLLELTVEQCEEWKEINNIPPIYAKEETILEYRELRRLINERIKSSKIEGIISIFKELDDDEKEKCIKLLHNLR